MFPNSIFDAAEPPRIFGNVGFEMTLTSATALREGVPQRRPTIVARRIRR